MPVNDYGMTYGTDGFVIEDTSSFPNISGVFEKWDHIVNNWTAAVDYARPTPRRRGTSPTSVPTASVPVHPNRLNSPAVLQRARILGMITSPSILTST